MKVVLLAGGRGTRLAEETDVRPKPMVEIGGRPILWHIMRHYAHHGCNEFIVAAGYRGEVIKRYFLDYSALSGDLTVNLSTGAVVRKDPGTEDWLIHVIDTGLDTSTGGRVKRLRSMIGDQTFMVTYGDGLSNVDIQELLEFHRQRGKVATVTAVRPPARFGALAFDGDEVVGFVEKPQAEAGWINGGFFVFEPSVFEYLEGDSSALESNALERIAAEGQLAAYRHDRFWQCMDTLRDKILLARMWESGEAPWKTW